MDELVTAITPARAVLVGEAHDRLDHHLNQLEIIRRLHRKDPQLAIGMEQFQQPFQAHLDDYIAGRIDVAEMLRRTEYFERWRYDYRLYEPILAYAREHRIPLIALNLPVELTRKVAAGGISALDPAEATQIPDIDRSDTAYRERLREIFEQHPVSHHGGSFENFHTAQLLWDEGMADRAAAYLRNHPGNRLVILAGAGHVDFRYGIPNRLARRIEGDVVTISHSPTETDSARADFILSSRSLKLPQRGLLGVMIDPDSEGARVSTLSEDGAAQAAGVRPGDVIVAVNREPVDRFADLRTSLWNKLPGDEIAVTVRRDDDVTLRFAITLR